MTLPKNMRTMNGGLGGEIDPCRNPLVTVYPPAARRARAFLVVRRLGHPDRPFRGGRGPSLWCRGFALEGRTCDQHDAFCIAAWLSRADRDGSFAAFLNPDLSPAERAVAQVEGWILGVPGLIRAGKARDDSAASEACDPSVFRLH
jgi:hypothetical protein